MLSNAAGCIMYLDLVPAMEFMPSSLQAAAFNIGIKIGLLHGAGTRFVT